MAWGDIAAGLGGALSSGLDTYKWQQERQDRKDRDEQVNDIKRQLQEMKGKQEVEQIEARNVGKKAIQELVNAGKLDVKRLDNEGDAYVTQLVTDRTLSVEEGRAISRMSVANRMAAAREYAADQGLVGTKYRADVGLAGTKYSSDSSAAASKYRADMGYNETIDNQNIVQGGLNARQAEELPLKQGALEVNQANAVSNRNRYNQPGVTLPTFTPTETFRRQNQDRGQAPFQGPIDPLQQMRPLNPPPGNFSPAPGYSPTFIQPGANFSPTSPGVGSATFPASPPPAAPVGVSPVSPGVFGTTPPAQPSPQQSVAPRQSLVTPAAAGRSAMLQPAPMPAPPPSPGVSAINAGAATRERYAPAQQETQAQQLMARIQAADKIGDRRTARALRDQLRAILDQQSR